MNGSGPRWSDRWQNRLPGALGNRSPGRDAPPTPPPASVPAGWDFLTAAGLFGDLAAPDREWIETSVPALTFGPGRLVHEAGQAGEILFWLWRGRLALIRAAGGRRIEVAAIEPGTIFGELVLAGQRLAGVRVEAVEESSVRLFRRADWERVLTRQPAVAVRLLEILGQRVIQHSATRPAEPIAEPGPAAPPPGAARRNNATSPSPPPPAGNLTSQIADLLLRLADRHTGELIGVTPQRLAEATGADPTAIGDLIDEFVRAHYLERAGPRSRLRNPTALRRLAAR